MEDKILEMIFDAGADVFDLLPDVQPFTRVKKVMLEAGFKQSLFLQALGKCDEDYTEPLTIFPPLICVNIANVTEEENFDLFITLANKKIRIRNVCSNIFLFADIETFIKLCEVEDQENVGYFTGDKN